MDQKSWSVKVQQARACRRTHLLVAPAFDADADSFERQNERSWYIGASLHGVVCHLA